MTVVWMSGYLQILNGTESPIPPKWVWWVLPRSLVRTVCAIAGTRVKEVGIHSGNTFFDRCGWKWYGWVSICKCWMALKVPSPQIESDGSYPGPHYAQFVRIGTRGGGWGGRHSLSWKPNSANVVESCTDGWAFANLEWHWKSHSPKWVRWVLPRSLVCMVCANAGMNAGTRGGLNTQSWKTVFVQWGWKWYWWEDISKCLMALKVPSPQNEFDGSCTGP